MSVTATEDGYVWLIQPKMQTVTKVPKKFAGIYINNVFELVIDWCCLTGYTSFTVFFGI